MSEDKEGYSSQLPDELLYNLLVGREGRMGLFPEVEKYFKSQLEGLGSPDSSPYTYTGDRIADFSPRERLAMQYADQGLGSFIPYLARSKGLTEEALATLSGGTSEAKSQLLRSLQQGEDYTRAGIDIGRSAVTAQEPYIKEALQRTRSSTRGFDPSTDISKYMDPYEDDVVQQVMKDIRDSQATSDVARRAAEVGSGGYGGSRSGVSQQESDRQTTRGLAESVGAIRSRGYENARQSAMSEFARQRGADASAAGMTAGLGSQVAGARSGLASLVGGAGQQLYGMGTGASSGLAGLAGQLAGGMTGGAGAYSSLAQLNPQLRQGDVNTLMNIGGMNRARNQAGLDLNYQNFVGQYNLPQQLLGGYANFLTGAGPLAGGVGYSGPAYNTPGSIYGPTVYGSTGGEASNLKSIPPEKKGLLALAKRAPEAVRKMGYQAAKKGHGGGLSSVRFPMATRKLR
jgi:hypothetical protein